MNAVQLHKFVYLNSMGRLIARENKSVNRRIINHFHTITIISPRLFLMIDFLLLFYDKKNI